MTVAAISLVGKRIEAEIVEIYAAVTNSDLTEGRGVSVDHSYHETEIGAKFGAVGIGPGLTKNDGTVGERLAIRLSDGTYLLLNQQSPIIELVDETRLREDVRRQAIAKLSPAERVALDVHPNE